MNKNSPASSIFALLHPYLLLPKILVTNISLSSALVKDGKYKVRILTRDLHSKRAKELEALPGVELMEGTFANQDTLRKGYEGCDGAVRTL